MKILFLLLLGITRTATSSPKNAALRALRNYPIPVPHKPYPQVTPNSYRSDNAWGEIRTASQSDDQFRVEIDYGGGKRQGVVVYKRPDGQLQRQYYSTGPQGYRLERSNKFVESAPRRRRGTTSDLNGKSVATDDRRQGDDELIQAPPGISPGRLAAGLIRQQAFETASKQDHNSNAASTSSEQLLSVLRPPQTSSFLHQLLQHIQTDRQISISRPQTVAIAGPSGEAEAITSGTALAGPGSVAVAAPESVAIAGPGGTAFSTSSGISSVDTNFDNDELTLKRPQRQKEQTTPEQQRQRRPYNSYRKPQTSDVMRPQTYNIQTPDLKRPPVRRQDSLLFPPTPTDLRLFPSSWTLFDQALAQGGRGSLAAYSPGPERPNSVFRTEKGETVILAHPNSNVATFYHHAHHADKQTPFTFQKHGHPFFYYFQY